MESKENAAEGNVGNKQVKEIVEPTIVVPTEAKVNVAIDEMAAQKADSAPVIDEQSKLIGTVSRADLNRKVGGLGHADRFRPSATRRWNDLAAASGQMAKRLSSFSLSRSA